MARRDLPRTVASTADGEPDLDREAATTGEEDGPVIEVLSTLSTGTAATAAATLLWQWVAPRLTDAPEGVAEWFRSGAELTIKTGASPQGLADTVGDLHYHDGGDNLVAVLRAR